MRCFVCDGAAYVWDRDPDGKSVDCSACGRYDITASTLVDMYQNIRVFTVDLTRTWLHEQREDGENPPLIERHTAFWD